MICVSIGRGRHRHVIAEHRHLAENGVPLVELRLDYLQGTVQAKRLLAERPCPVIVTCRRVADGGRWEQSEEARQNHHIQPAKSAAVFGGGKLGQVGVHREGRWQRHRP